MECEIRAARPTDLLRIHDLCRHLGYQPSLAQVELGLKALNNDPRSEVVVATSANRVVGWMTICHRHRIEGESFLQIAALVTDESVRGQGFGRKLLEYAQTRAAQLGVTTIGLYSSRRRHEAHEFYKKAGFQVLKESLFLQKNLA